MTTCSIGSFHLTLLVIPCLVAYLLKTYGISMFRYDNSPLFEISGGALSSSVWCRGANRSDRHCRFKNLCYRRQSDEFLFVHGPGSVMLGLDSRNGYIADMTSVDELNIHYFTFTDLPANALNQTKVIFIEGDTLFLKRFKPDNIMHVIHDDVLPLYATLRELCFGDDETCFNAFRIVLMDGKPDGPLEPYYSLISSNVMNVNILDNQAIYCFERVYVGINKETTWYNYGFSRPQHPIQRRPSLATIQSFLHFAMTRLGISRNDCHAVPYFVLVSRNRDRLILNEQEVVEAVTQATSWEVVRLEDDARLDPKRALRHIACAEMLIGMHGAELILAIFMKAQAILLELFPYAVPAEEYTPYRTLASIPGMHLVYGAWENVLPHNSRSYPDRSAQWGGLLDLSPDERQRIMKSERITPHLCCDNRNWLYRIYQDTVVDIPTLKDVLSDILKKQEQTAMLDNVSSYEDDLYPGPVRNAICHIHNSATDQSHYVLTWTAPWNVKYLNRDHDFNNSNQYEIWIQKVGENNLRAVLTDDTRYVISDIDGIQFDCWIGTTIRNKTGNRQWVRCG